MEKSKKLRRYSRKDYSQVVDFPVEIVGRDGVIRRYSFEASVRLYQRRIASASGRYGDRDVVSAEVSHCQRRIEQLRRSYYHRYGWSESPVDASSALSGAFAGEVAAFLRRFYAEQGIEGLDVAWLAEGDHHTLWFVRRPGDTAYMLYLYRFESFGACEGREAFFSSLRMLQQARGQDVEALVAFHHTGDCGLVLSCQGEHASAALGPIDQEPFLDAEAVPGDAYAHGLRLLAEGESVQALERFEAAVQASPFRRPAILAVCVVADLCGRPDSAETAARIGVNSFPSDAVVRYHLGLALARRGELEPACEQLERTLSLRPDLTAARLLLGAVLAQRRSWRAVALLRGIPSVEVEEQALARTLLVGLVARALLLATLPLAAVLAVGAGWLASVWLACAALVAGLAALALIAAIRVAVVAGDLRRLRIPAPEGLGSRGPRLDDVVT